MRPQERADPGVIPGYLPELTAVLAFVDRLVMPFEGAQTPFPGGPRVGPGGGDPHSGGEECRISVLEPVASDMDHRPLLSQGLHRAGPGNLDGVDLMVAAGQAGFDVPLHVAQRLRE